MSLGLTIGVVCFGLFIMAMFALSLCRCAKRGDEMLREFGAGGGVEGHAASQSVNCEDNGRSASPVANEALGETDDKPKAGIKPGPSAPFADDYDNTREKASLTAGKDRQQFEQHPMHRYPSGRWTIIPAGKLTKIIK
jgi:hypothetical protein